MELIAEKKEFGRRTTKFFTFWAFRTLTLRMAGCGRQVNLFCNFVREKSISAINSLFLAINSLFH